MEPRTQLFLTVLCYNFSAVLTPCGPLKALVNVMQQSDAPPLPGLLYEAQLPSEARRPGRRRQQQQNNENSADGNTEPPSPMSTDEAVADSVAANIAATGEEIEVSDATGPPPSGRLPLAIAKLYRLQLVEPIEPSTRRPSFVPLLEADGSPQIEQQEQQQGSSPNEVLAQQYTAEQLCQSVECQFPRGGGRIDRQRNGSGDVRYVVKDRHGVVKRILLIDEEGKVFEERSSNTDDEDDKDNNIKLGLGDFIFYSVLVSKAVQYSFTTFAACMLVVLAGLGGTLILLAVYQHALPALPISIFLGVVFYLLTRLLIEPWIHQVLQRPYYV